MRAVTFQAPFEVRVEEKPEPELQAPDDAVVRIEATGVCGSDLHIFHGRVQIEPGFTIGHEYVGTVVAEHGVATGVAVDEVVPDPGVQAVVAGPAADPVVAAERDAVVRHRRAGTGPDERVALHVVQLIGDPAHRAGQAGGVGDPRRLGDRRRLRRRAVLVHVPDAAAVAEDRVVAGLAVERVVAQLAVEVVVTGAADDRLSTSLHEPDVDSDDSA